MFLEYFNNNNIYFPAQGIPNSTVDIIAPHCEIPRKEYKYKYNNDGIRTIDFLIKPNVITMGCSITFGMGLPNNVLWPILLENKLKEHGAYTVGNLSYNGASAVKNISSFFGFIKKYNYLPEYLICNFANFERSVFFQNKAISDIFWYANQFKFEDSYPYDYEKILPVEWLHFINLEYIKILEIFCRQNNIKLIWSTWSHKINGEYEENIKKHYPSYIEDRTRVLFPQHFENGYDAKHISNLGKYTKMKNWDKIKCHYDVYQQYPEIFHHAYDYHNIPQDYVKGDTPVKPHPGVHNQFHWAEMFYEEMKKIL